MYDYHGHEAIVVVVVWSGQNRVWHFGQWRPTEWQNDKSGDCCCLVTMITRLLPRPIRRQA
jgi:hypothetical protein